MKRKTMKTYRAALGYLLLPALWVSGRHMRDLSKSTWEKLPAGSVAPLY